MNEVILELKLMLGSCTRRDTPYYMALQEAIRCMEENEKLKDENNAISHGYLEHIEALQNLHQQEIDNLEYKVQYLTDCGIEKEEKYKEALRKCGPSKSGNFWLCSFCNIPYYNSHTDDCEYVRLCGNDTNVGITNGGAE